MTHPAGTSLDREPPPGKKWHDLVKQGTCRVCRIPLYGWEPLEREVCGNSHCRAEARRKRPCKFPRLRNLEVEQEARTAERRTGNEKP